MTKQFPYLTNTAPKAVVLAGGQSLIPLMKLQLAAPEYVVDINRIPGLAGISEENDFLRIGSLTREADLDRSEIVRAKYPILQDTTSVIADPISTQYGYRRRQSGARRPRQRSSPPLCWLWERKWLLWEQPGQRVISVSDFFEGPLMTTLKSGGNPHGNQNSHTSTRQWRCLPEA